MLHPYRTIEIELEGKEGSPVEIRVPFTVELLHKVEETLGRTVGRKWFVLRRSDKSLIEAYEDFCRPYFPEHFDWSQVDPTFAALFFSNVKDTLLHSIDACERSMLPTETPTEPTAEKETTDATSPSSTES